MTLTCASSNLASPTINIKTFNKMKVLFFNYRYNIRSHNLLALAEKCDLELTDEQLERLQIITQFNISARYEDYKESFYQKCTDEYTAKQVKNIEEVYVWLKNMLIVK